MYIFTADRGWVQFNLLSPTVDSPVCLKLRRSWVLAHNNSTRDHNELMLHSQQYGRNLSFQPLPYLSE